MPSSLPYRQKASCLVHALTHRSRPGMVRLFTLTPQHSRHEHGAETVPRPASAWAPACSDRFLMDGHALSTTGSSTTGFRSSSGLTRSLATISAASVEPVLLSVCGASLPRTVGWEGSLPWSSMLARRAYARVQQRSHAACTALRKASKSSA